MNNITEEIDELDEDDSQDEDFVESFEILMEGFNSFKELVRRKSNIAYERWKAGGFIVDSNIMSMYPNAEETFESLK